MASSAHGRPVAFTAKLKVEDSYPKQSGVLKFANVLFNEGGGYSPDTGVFTCPADGLYHFMVHMTIYGLGQGAIYKNGKKVVSLYHTNELDTLSQNSSQVGSISCVVKLSKRDEVWIHVWGLGRHEIFATEDNDTIFTGFYLR